MNFQKSVEKHLASNDLSLSYSDLTTENFSEIIKNWTVEDLAFFNKKMDLEFFLFGDNNEEPQNFRSLSSVFSTMDSNVSYQSLQLFNNLMTAKRIGQLANRVIEAQLQYVDTQIEEAIRIYKKEHQTFLENEITQWKKDCYEAWIIVENKAKIEDLFHAQIDQSSQFKLNIEGQDNAVSLKEHLENYIKRLSSSKKKEL